MFPKLPLFHKVDSGNLSFKKDGGVNLWFRHYFLPLGIICLFLILMARLFQLTIVKGSYYRFLAENNRIKELLINAPRGTVVDRKGVPIATSEKKGNSFIRHYSLGQAAAHFLGYIQVASKEDIVDDACGQQLKLNDLVGRGGIEKLYECNLRGKKGKKLVEVDAHQREKRTLSYIPPVPGTTIQTSLDATLQQKAYDVLTTTTVKNSGGIVELPEKKAAVVAVKPDTGELLLFLSTPSFDPTVFVDANQDAIHSYLADDKKPLLNRAIQGVYPPGSVVKPFIATGALTDRTIDDKFTIEDTGTITAGPLTFGNWYFLQYGKTEGTVDVVKGLRRSNDIFFYRVGEKMGDGKLKAWLERFGLGRETNIGFPERAGLVPSSFWKQEKLGERWFLGDTYNTAIGQGFLQVTPLQINLATAAIANGGFLCKPHLLKNEKPDCKKLPVTEKSLELVREGMKQACASGGTGWPFFNFTPSVGCKTGTAESHLPSGLPHAWFTVFAPAENPEIVVTVMVEESGEGSNVAAPIAKEILKTYFERNE